LIAFLYLWLKFWEGIDKYWIVPVRKLLYFHHCKGHNGKLQFKHYRQQKLSLSRGTNNFLKKNGTADMGANSKNCSK